MSVMGKQISQFELPVCSKFKPKILKDRLCFQVDVNEFKEKIDVEQALQDGLIFIMDYNEEKMIMETSNQVNQVLTSDLSMII